MSFSINDRQAQRGSHILTCTFIHMCTKGARTTKYAEAWKSIAKMHLVRQGLTMVKFAYYFQLFLR